MAEQTDAERLAEANETIVGVVENGPWVLITDPALRQLVGGYVADACHSIAAAAGLDEAMERAHNAMPQRLDTTGRFIGADARERLARHLWIADAGGPELWDRLAAGDDRGEAWWPVAINGRQDLLAKANALLAVITEQEAGR